MTQHPQDALVAFALGDLDAAAGREVLVHADECASCAAALADLMRGVAAIAGDDGPSRRAATPRRSATGWLLGLSTAAAVLLGVWNLDLRSAQPTVPIDALVHSHFTHHPLTGGEGSAKLIQALDGSWVYVVADGLRPLETYAVAINGVAIGTFHADRTGRATAYFARPAGKITEASLTPRSGTGLRWSAK